MGNIVGTRKKHIVISVVIVTIIVLILVGVSFVSSTTSDAEYYILDWEVLDNNHPPLDGYSVENTEQQYPLDFKNSQIASITARLLWSEDDETPPLLTTNEPDAFALKLVSPTGEIIGSTFEEDGEISLTVTVAEIPPSQTFSSKNDAEKTATNIQTSTSTENGQWQVLVVMGSAGQYLRPLGFEDPRNADEGNSWSLIITYRRCTSVIMKLQGRPATDFTTTDIDGNKFTLSDLKGKVIILEFVHVCECTADRNSEQFNELKKCLEKFSSRKVSAVTITFADSKGEVDNARDKYSIDWTVVYDSGDLPILEKYKEYWSGRSGEFYDPTIVLIDEKFNVVGSYHVTSTHDVLRASDMEDKIARIMSGNWNAFEGALTDGGASFAGMFTLGILTSVSPCSVVLLITLLSFIMTTNMDDGTITPTGLKPGTKNERKKASPMRPFRGVYIGTVFTLGMCVVFFVLGLLISQAGTILSGAAVFYFAAGVLLILFGINSIKPLRDIFEPLLQYLPRRTHSKKTSTQSRSRSKPTFMETTRTFALKVFKSSTTTGSFTLGVLFTLGWAPCALALIMPAVILLLAHDVSIITGAFLFLTFGLGHGIIIIPVAAATTATRAKLGRFFMKWGTYLKRSFGVVIMIIGVLMIARYYGLYLW